MDGGRALELLENSSAVERTLCSDLDCVWVLASVVVFLCCSPLEEIISVEEESVSAESRCYSKSQEITFHMQSALCSCCNSYKGARWRQSRRLAD